MNPSPGAETIRLTMSQAVVKFLQAQYSERDGRTRRLIPAMFGIFGHGNVCGMGQALEECGRDLPYYQPCNEQAMVHTAIGFAKANRRLAEGAGFRLESVRGGWWLFTADFVKPELLEH